MSKKSKIILYGTILFLSLSFFGTAKADWEQPASSTLSTNIGMPSSNNIASGTVSFGMTITGLKLRLSASSTSHLSGYIYATKIATSSCNNAYLDPDAITITLNTTSDFGGGDQNPIIYNENVYSWNYHGTNYYPPLSNYGGTKTDDYPTIPPNYTWCINVSGDYSINNLRSYGTTIESPGSQYLVSSISGITYPYYDFKGTEANNINLIDATILFPFNTTSTYIHDFNYFMIVATSTDASDHFYSYKILTDTTSTFSNAPYWSFINSQVLLAGETKYYGIPNLTDMNNTSSTQIYYSKLCVTDTYTDSEKCYAPISYNLGKDAVGFKANTYGVGVLGRTLLEAELPTIPIQNNRQCEDAFYSPYQWACIALNSIENLTQSLSDSWKTGLETITHNVNTVFPMSVIGTLKDDISLVTATTTDHKIILTGQGTAFKKKGGGYNSFTFLSSSTIKTAEANSGLPFETLIVNIIYLADAMIIIGGSFMILHHRTKKHA